MPSADTEFWTDLSAALAQDAACAPTRAECRDAWERVRHFGKPDTRDGDLAMSALNDLFYAAQRGDPKSAQTIAYLRMRAPDIATLQGQWNAAHDARRDQMLIEGVFAPKKGPADIVPFSMRH